MEEIEIRYRASIKTKHGDIRDITEKLEENCSIREIISKATRIGEKKQAKEAKIQIQIPLKRG